MRINYTGKLAGITADQQEKLQLRFAKLAKLLDTSVNQRQAHVIIKSERRLTKAEITVHYAGHDVVGAASHADPYSAMTDAAHKLESQIVKLHQKRVDGKRHSIGVAKATPPPAKETTAPAPARPVKPRVYRPRVAEASKPMTAEEAIASMGKKVTYLLFRHPDAEASTLVVRRADGHFDIIETQ